MRYNKNGGALLRPPDIWQIRTAELGGAYEKQISGTAGAFLSFGGAFYHHFHSGAGLRGGPSGPHGGFLRQRLRGGPLPGDKGPCHSDKRFPLRPDRRPGSGGGPGLPGRDRH